MIFLCRLRRRRRVVRPRGKLYELTPFKDQVELHRARRVEREFDHHQVRRIIIARSRGTLEHGSVQALWVSLETAHSQEPLRARNHAWNPLSNRIIHSFELRAPLFAPPHRASDRLFCRCATRQVAHGQVRSRFALRAQLSGRRVDRARGGQLGLVRRVLRPRCGRERPTQDHFTPFPQLPPQTPSVANSHGHFSVPHTQKVRAAATTCIAPTLPRRVSSCVDLPALVLAFRSTSRLLCAKPTTPYHLDETATHGTRFM